MGKAILSIPKPQSTGTAACADPPSPTQGQVWSLCRKYVTNEDGNVSRRRRPFQPCEMQSEHTLQENQHPLFNLNASCVRRKGRLFSEFIRRFQNVGMKHSSEQKHTDVFTLVPSLRLCVLFRLLCTLPVTFPIVLRQKVHF